VLKGIAEDIKMYDWSILEVQVIKEKNIYILHSIRPNLTKISKRYFDGGVLTAISLEVLQ